MFIQDAKNNIIYRFLLCFFLFLQGEIRLSSGTSGIGRVPWAELVVEKELFKMQSNKHFGSLSRKSFV